MTRFFRAATLRALAACALPLLAAACGSGDPSTPQEAATRGDGMLREMSDALAKASAFSFTVAETHERVRRNGEKESYTINRDVVARRPNRLWSHATGGGDDRDVTVTYDGAAVTVVGATQKVYAAIKAPPTLDEMLDLVSERFDLRLAPADLLYSSPYDSFAEAGAEGGWTGRTTIDGRECQEVSYKLKAVDFTLALASAEPHLPCQAQIVFKAEPGQPVTKLAFSNWNLAAAPEDALFVAKVPEGYEQIPVLERIPKDELKADAAKAMGATAAK